MYYQSTTKKNAHTNKTLIYNYKNNGIL